MFSIVIPLYNKDKSIGNTIRSVLAQTVTDFEVLIINDGSTDRSREIVANIPDDRIRIVDKLNGGISNARNTGIKAAKYEHIAFIDADDHWEADFLETIKALIADYPDAGCYATGYACKYNNVTLNVFGANKRGVISDFFEQVYKGPVMHSSSVCIKKSTFNVIGYFNADIHRGEDYDMWARLGRESSIAASPETKAWYRLDSENREMSSVPLPQKLWLYHIPPESAQNKVERRYYRRFLHRQVMEYLIKGKFKWAWEIASRNWKVARWYSYLLLPGNLQLRQFSSWLKLRINRSARKDMYSYKAQI